MYFKNNMLWRLLHKESIMNFLLLSIVSCLLLPNINYASTQNSQKRSGWFPIATYLIYGKEKTTDQHNIPKNLSENSLAIKKNAAQSIAVNENGEYGSEFLEDEILSPSKKSTNNLSSLVEPTSNTTRPVAPTISPLREAQQIDWTSYNAKLATTTEESQSRSESPSQGRSTPTNFIEQNNTKPTGFMEVDRNSDSAVATDDTNNQFSLSHICGCCFKKKSCKS